MPRCWLRPAALRRPTGTPYTLPGVLRIGVVRDVDTLDPLLSGQAGMTDLAQFLFSGLIRYDDRGEAIPDAAIAVPTRENGGISADGRTITYHLRHDVRFCDGQPELREAGFDVQVRNAPASQLFSAYAAGGIFATGKFDLGIYAWTKVPDPDDTETIGPDRVPPRGANYSGLVDAQIGRLQAAGARSYDRTVRRPIYARLQRRVQDVLPYQTMVWRANIDAYNDDLRNFKPAPAVSDFWNVAQWSI